MHKPYPLLRLLLLQQQQLGNVIRGPSLADTGRSYDRASSMIACVSFHSGSNSHCQSCCCCFSNSVWARRASVRTYVPQPWLIDLILVRAAVFVFPHLHAQVADVTTIALACMPTQSYACTSTYVWKACIHNAIEIGSTILYCCCCCCLYVLISKRAKLLSGLPSTAKWLITSYDIWPTLITGTSNKKLMNIFRHLYI